MLEKTAPHAMQPRRVRWMTRIGKFELAPTALEGKNKWTVGDLGLNIEGLA